jgi:glycine/D-amino acid oxidase-like deaminating enzyme
MSASDAAIYGSSLFAATTPLPPPRPPLTVDLDVDVCVIGGGLAGLTAAREVARRGWSVAVLEGRRVAWNASGRNTGFVLPGFAQTPEKIVERVGRDHARALWALSQAGLDYVRRTIEDNGIAADASAGWLYVSKTDRADAMQGDADLMRALGAHVDFLPTEQVRALLKTAYYFQAIGFPDAFNIQPLAYALALARLAEEAGARIYEDTPALSIDPAGVRKRVMTAQARVRAGHIVLAGNVHLGSVMPHVARTLVPVRTYVVATTPLGERLAEAMSYRGSVSDTDWADNHYRPVGDRLVFSGRMTTWDADPWRFAKTLRRDMLRVFPQLGEIEIEHAWTGTLGNAVHRMPQIGEAANGVWLAAGFGGHGINTTAMAGDMIARAIVEGDDDWRLFLPFELIWAGGALGRTVAQTAYWVRRTGERLAARAARRAERRRQDAAEIVSATPEEPLEAALEAEVEAEDVRSPVPEPPAMQVAQRKRSRRQAKRNPPDGSPAAS